LVYNEYKEKIFSGGNQNMHEHKHSSHRFSNYEENAAFPNEDGIEVFQTGARFQHCLYCNETEIQAEVKGLIESALFEKRKHPQSLKDQFFVDFI
jgi:hypothetical protein